MAKKNESDVYKPEVTTVSEEVDAQVAPPREPDSDKVQVHEVSVQLDRVITDPSSPEAVQVPEEGKGNTDLPAHRLDAPSAEEVLGGADAAEGQETERVESQQQDAGERDAPAPVEDSNKS